MFINGDLMRFIVGMSRAGTTWLTRSLNLHPRVVAFGETCYWGRKYVAPRNGIHYTDDELRYVIDLLAENRMGPRGNSPGALQRTTIEEMANIIRDSLGQLSAPVTPVEVFAALCEAFCAAEEKDIAVEKTPHHLNWVDRIKKAIPAAKFVVMVREPYGFMLSYKHQGLRNRPEVRDLFERLYHPLVAAIVWRGYARSVRYAKEHYPGDVLVVDLERVVVDSKAVLADVCCFYELPPFEVGDGIPQDNSSFGDYSRPTIGPDDLFWINWIAGKEIERGGYSLCRRTGGMLRVVYSFVQLPIWFVRNIADIRRRVPGSFLSYVRRWLMSPRS